jgi:APA family basic amino acid/polyamine antiporter
VVLTGTYQELYSYVVFAIWIFLGLSALALIRLRSTQPDLPRPFRVWGYPWTPLLFGFAAFAISLNLWLMRPVRSSVGLLIILSGVPLFYYWRQRGMTASRLVDAATSAKQNPECEVKVYAT